MNQKEINSAKNVVRNFVNMHKSRLPKDHMFQYDDLKRIIQDSVNGLKASNQISKKSEGFNFYSIISDEILREELSILKTDKDLEKNIICEKDHQSWLLNTGQPIDPDRKKITYKYWDRYRKFISNQKKVNMEDFDGEIRQIVSNLRDPLDRNQEGWLNRGMVVGSVQSGKTMNYAGVVAQAFDAGYQFVVVLGGAGRKLRAQTQARIDEGVLGVDTSRNIPGYIGAGKLDIRDRDGNKISYQPISSLTTSYDGGLSGKDGDFSTKSKKVQNYNVEWNKDTPPHLFVMKKNKAILENFLEWIEQMQRDSKDRKAELSLLIIDDECDYASIDTNKADEMEDILDDDYEASAINQCIVDILQKFKWRSYLGYTATPYGNIFQRRDINEIDESLFPRNFIIYLQPNRMYFGPSEFFNSSSSENPIDLIRNIPFKDSGYFYDIVNERNKIWREKELYSTKYDTEERKKELSQLRRHETITLLNKYENDKAPESLSIAIKSFIISCAIRWNRGEKNVFNSMLIHIQREVPFQDFIIRMVKEEFEKIKNQVYNQNLKSFEAIYNQDYVETTCDVLDSDLIDKGLKIGMQPLGSFKSIVDAIDEVISRISIVKEYGKDRQSRLDYSEDKKGNYYICVGSDVLSRGLTLEGLSVSYFLREAKTYDTLMQMGRWFGYRSGYLDVCRVYTTPTIVEFFQNVKDANEAMYRMFQTMNERDDIPENFGMYILSSQSAQKVTGYGKTRYAQKISLDLNDASHNEMRTDISQDRLNSNLKFINNFLIGKTDESKNENRQIYNLDSQDFIHFINNYKFSFDHSRKPIDQNFIPNMYIDYINKVESKFQSFKGFKLILTSTPKSDRVSWIVNGNRLNASERFIQGSGLRNNNFWYFSSSASDGQADKDYQEKYLSNGIGFIMLRPIYGPSDFSKIKLKYNKNEILQFIDDKSYKDKGIEILGIDNPIFHELVRMPSRSSLGLDENETRMDLVVDQKYLENLEIPFEQNEDGEYI